MPAAEKDISPSKVTVAEPVTTTITINDHPFTLTVWTPEAWAIPAHRADDARHMGGGIHYRLASAGA